MSCASEEEGVCFPDPAFARRLCDASYPDVALVLMAKESPFSRMFLRGDVDGELTLKRPPAPKHSGIAWRHLTERTRDALLQNDKIHAAFQRRGKECKGVISGEVSKACETADAALSAAVVGEVRAGMPIPTPDRLP
jgi:hypothetical protein